MKLLSIMLGRCGTLGREVLEVIVAGVVLVLSIVDVVLVVSVAIVVDSIFFGVRSLVNI